MSFFASFPARTQKNWQRMDHSESSSSVEMQQKESTTTAVQKNITIKPASEGQQQSGSDSSTIPSIIQNIAGHVFTEERSPTTSFDGNGYYSTRSNSNCSVTSVSHLIEQQHQEEENRATKYIDFTTAFDYFVHHKKEDLAAAKKNVKYAPGEGELTVISESCCFCLTRRKRILFESLENDLLEELRSYLALMTVPFSNGNSVHVDICLEVFYSIMQRELVFSSTKTEEKKSDPSPISQEWELIGFLGPNLEEEFRGFGIFGALMLLYFCTHHSDLAEKIYHLSQDEKRHFPFVISILHLLRLGKYCHYIV